MPDEPTKEPEAVLLQLIRGGQPEEKEPVSVGAELFERKGIAVEAIDAIARLEGQIKELQNNIGGLDIEIMRLGERKFGIFKQLEAKKKEQFDIAKDAAGKAGIREEDISKWTIDLAQQAFMRKFPPVS